MNFFQRTPAKNESTLKQTPVHWSYSSNQFHYLISAVVSGWDSCGLGSKAYLNKPHQPAANII